ncbi:hypothetical protein D9599_09800 [Roseomonas sp. KE2513]|uniref:hypothetical protein n=1 Tax=Roseomonas sp. KE2513 TaxID=2479202 RepID=UPI0018E024CA|nr:hypothetical protein [Roseomonas sp. KE2513]MBI0535863.1 hypothetical protein [Roseomonas sp. KE2513]
MAMSGTRRLRRCVAALAAAMVLPMLASAQVLPGPTLASIRTKGVLDCGVNPGSPGFGVPDSRGEHRGMGPSIWRTIAAAALGDPA